MKASRILHAAAATLICQIHVSAEPQADAPGVTLEITGKSVESNETSVHRDARMAWWREAKFGLFIHWGVYAVPAGSYQGNDTYGEWIMHHAKIPVAEYRKFAGHFNPVKYDPATWAKIAKDAGMRYMVITSKHHDGFALYPSDASTWDIADATPYRKDLLGPLVTAARNEGLKIGFYYSHAQDWNNPGGGKSRFDEGQGWDDAQNGNFDEYLANLAVPQVHELLTRYRPDVLWWDTPIQMTGKRADALAASLDLRPGIVTNNRLGAGYKGDTETVEQFVPVTAIPGDWETCMTMNAHWGYNAADQNWKSTADLIHKLAEICAKGGNFLLNVGPDANGGFPPASVERLHEIGRWLDINGEAIYGTKAGPFTYLSWGYATRKGSRLYLHVCDWPEDGKLRVPLQSGVNNASLLASPDQKLEFTREDKRIVISVPATAPDHINTVIMLELDGEPQAVPLPSAGARASATAAKPENGPENLLDGTGAKRWIAPDTLKSASVQIDLARASTISGFGFDEPDVWPRMKQKFLLEAGIAGVWTKVADGNTVGHGARASITPIDTRSLRITMECELGAPALAEVQFYSPE